MNQKQELTKPVVKVGNSAGVLLPREWLNGKAKVSLIEQPLDIKRDVMEILDSYLEGVIGIYLVGSYARGEQTGKSDVDVLVITNKTNKKIDKGRYNIILIDKERVKDAVKTLALPIIPMLREAKTILNDGLLEEHKREAKLTKKNAKPLIEITKSSLKVNREFIKLSKELGDNLGDGNSYSLVLGVRTLYLLSCLKKNKKQSSGELKKLIKNISGGLESYEGYLRIKNNEKTKDGLSVKEAEALYSYLEKELKKWETWLKERKN